MHPPTGAIGLVSNDDVWVEANMKETDLTYVRIGNHVDISVDTYPGREWSGTVESISPASGGSRVDVRSVSRVGRSDIGTNAKRIRGFLARLGA